MRNRLFPRYASLVAFFASTVVGAAGGQRRRGQVQEEGNRGQRRAADPADQAQGAAQGAEEADRPHPHGRGLRRPAAGQRSPRSPTSRSSYMQAADPDRAGRRSPEAGLLLPPGRALLRKAALPRLPGPRLWTRRSSRRSRPRTPAWPPSSSSKQKTYEKEAREVAARGGQELRRRLQVPQVQPHGRGAVPPRLPAADDQEGRPGA